MDIRNNMSTAKRQWNDVIKAAISQLYSFSTNAAALFISACDVCSVDAFVAYSSNAGAPSIVPSNSHRLRAFGIGKTPCFDARNDARAIALSRCHRGRFSLWRVVADSVIRQYGVPILLSVAPVIFLRLRWVVSTFAARCGAFGVCAIPRLRASLRCVSVGGSIGALVGEQLLFMPRSVFALVGGNNLGIVPIHYESL